MEIAKNPLSDMYTDEKIMSQLQINKLIKDTLQGLQQLYFQKITHRDIKPDNIFYMSNGEFKIGDFGTSRILDSKDQSITLIGTPAYFPPEVKKYYQKGRLISLSKEKSKTIDWYGFDTYSLGLCYIAAVCKIQSMTQYAKKFDQLLYMLQEVENKKLYDPVVFKIIRLMTQQDQNDRPTPGELIQMAEILKTE